MSSDGDAMKITGPVVAGFLFETSDSVRLSICGTSMAPLLREGTTVTIGRVGLETKLRSGDVYVFKSGGDLVAHRFVKMSSDKAVFAGDNRAFTELVERRDIIGRCETIRIPVLLHCLSVMNILLMAPPFLRKIGWHGKKRLIKLLEVLYEKVV
jgi:hypothetical protein